jgi:MinD-like ATPase involved in chromosome partitioning or flagellar assembly
VSFPLGPDTDSPALDEIVAGPAAALTAVVVVTGPAAVASGWAAAAAAALARRWTPRRRVLLADLDLVRPALHEALGVGNETGVIDVIEYGLSPGQAVQTVGDGQFDFLAGGYALDPGAVLRSPFWSRLLSELAARRATLLAVVPHATAGLEALIERAGSVIVLAEPDEAETVVAALPRPYAVLAVLVPAPAKAGAPPAPKADTAGATPAQGSDAASAAAAAPAAPAAVEPPAAEPAAADAGAAARGPRVPVPAGVDDTAVLMRVESAGDDVDLDAIDPGPARAAPPRPRFARPVGWTVAIVLMASLLAGAWRYLSNRGAATDRSIPVAELEPTVAVVPDTTADTPLPWEVTLEAHRDLATAFERVSVLADAEPAVRFHVEPLEREGTMLLPRHGGTGARLRDGARACATR